LEEKLFTGFYKFSYRKKKIKNFMLNLLYLSLFSSCDAPSPWGLYFQDSATPQMEGLVELHDNIMFYLVIILFGVG
jgi:cytochrome c oxidase subunit 2